jgi:glyoxylase-like metal-dependent hydrolase (beta-lactamase superfamily II)/rhodanese-related sulfurtransferase
MLFRQIIHEDLGCASYLVADRESGVAVVVDPQWDVEPYRRLARLHGVQIGHALETHNHADHVSGHGRLARTTGATIHIHEQAAAEYPHESFVDGWRLQLGDLTIEAIHTPGHRPEHTAFLLCDASRDDAPWAVLGGDSLFIGDVARPDLAVEPREGAADMFRSLHERLLVLDDEVEIWPGHLGGSLCGGAAIDLKTSSTIGFERRHNRALQIESEAEFVEDAVGSLSDRPPNIEQIVALNRGPLVDDFGTPAALTPHEVEAAVAAGACVIDGRTNDQFDEAHIAGALSTSSYDTGFATKVSRVAPEGAEIIVVGASDGDERDAAELLAAVGMRVRGFLEGGMTAWRMEERSVERIELIDPDELAARMNGSQPPLILDVRNASEYAGEHIPSSLHIPYGDLGGRLDELPRDRPIAAICRGGKRSGLAASILRREGFAEVVHVGQGVGVWRAGGHPVESGAPALARPLS